jgi:hypothetical protein
MDRGGLRRGLEGLGFGDGLKGKKPTAAGIVLLMFGVLPLSGGGFLVE